MSNQWAQKIHDFLGTALGFPCNEDERKSARFTDMEKRHMATVHNTCIAAGATCGTKKSAVAQSIGDVIAKASGDDKHGVMSAEEAAAARKAVLKAIWDRPNRGPAVGFRETSPWR